MPLARFFLQNYNSYDYTMNMINMMFMMMIRMDEGDAITLEDGELTIQIRRAPPKVIISVYIEYQDRLKWLLDD